MTFVSEFGSFAYRVMPLGIKNEPTIFSRIVVKAFQEYIYKTMVVYFDDWTIYNLFKNHIQWLKLMLEGCRQIQFYLNIKKCIFSTPIRILLGHVVCKDGVKVDMGKIKIILNLKPLVKKKHIKIFLGHTWYYPKFIHHYLDITFPIDELLQKEIEFRWSQDCQESFKILKMKLVEAPILKFTD
jgi:hypothetical protein